MNNNNNNNYGGDQIQILEGLEAEERGRECT